MRIWKHDNSPASPFMIAMVYQLILFGFPDLKKNYSQNNNPFTFLSSVPALIKLTAW